MQDPSADRLDAAFDRPFVRMAVGCAVAFYHNAFQAQQAGAIVTRRIYPAFEPVQHRHRNGPAQIGKPVALELLGKELAQHVDDAL